MEKRYLKRMALHMVNMSFPVPNPNKSPYHICIIQDISKQEMKIDQESMQKCRFALQSPGLRTVPLDHRTKFFLRFINNRYTQNL
jgi:hypothetical protein